MNTVNSTIVLTILVIIAVLIFLPLIALLAVNNLFDLEIAYDLANWFWMLLLLMLFGNHRAGSKS